MARVLRQIAPRYAVPIPFVYEWWRSNCNEEPPPQPSLVPIPPPFTGGQCPTMYRVNYTNYLFNVDPQTGQRLTTTRASGPFNADGMGPFSGTYSTKDPPAPANGNQGAERIFLNFASNDVQIFFGGIFPIGNGSDYSHTVINSVTRLDGQPDNCGSPPTTLPPAQPPPNPEINYNFDYTDSSGNTVNVDARINIGPFTINSNNQVSVPFTISYAPDYSTSFHGAFNSDGEMEFNFGDSNYNFGGTPGCQPNPDNFVPDADTPDDVTGSDEPPDPEEDDPTPVIRGCIVTTTVIPEHQSIIYQDDNPDIMIPRLGNVQFLIAIGNRAAWSDDIPVRNRRHFIACPWEGGAIQVRGTPAPGVQWSISPCYAREQYPVVFLT